MNNGLPILAAQGESVEATLAASNRDDPPSAWSQSLKAAIRSGHRLLSLLSLPHELYCPESEADFPVLVPLEYVRRMQPGSPDDPLLLQVLAGRQEQLQLTQGALDPVGDGASEVIPGLLQKYSHRALLITTGACAVHCRYCFRRHFPYHEAPTGPAGWQPALEAIRADRSLEEVILSGGDPLSVRDSSLDILTKSLDAIPHVKRIRVHTRFPVMIPERICDSLLHWVSHLRSAVFFVLHFNHAAEIDDSVRQAMRRLRSAGATLLNQAVLLRGINDSLTSQLELCKSLIDMQVLPYYLHQLDPVQGGMHFGVSDTKGLQILAGLKRELPGYGVPKLVREIASRPHKVDIC